MKKIGFFKSFISVISATAVGAILLSVNAAFGANPPSEAPPGNTISPTFDALDVTGETVTGDLRTDELSASGPTDLDGTISANDGTVSFANEVEANAGIGATDGTVELNNDLQFGNNELMFNGGGITTGSFQNLTLENGRLVINSDSVTSLETNNSATINGDLTVPAGEIRASTGTVRGNFVRGDSAIYTPGVVRTEQLDNSNGSSANPIQVLTDIEMAGGSFERDITGVDNLTTDNITAYGALANYLTILDGFTVGQENANTNATFLSDLVMISPQNVYYPDYSQTGVDESQLWLNGNAYIHSEVDASLANDTAALRIGAGPGDPASWSWLGIDDNEILSNGSALYLNREGGEPVLIGSSTDNAELRVEGNIIASGIISSSSDNVAIGSATREWATISVNPNQTASNSVTCPAGKVLLSCGYWVQNIRYVQGYSYPGTDRCYAGFFNSHGTNSYSANVYALCHD